MPWACRELACLAQTPSEAVMAGNIKFSSEGLEEEGGPAAAETAATAEQREKAAAPAADGAA